jgi:hypothetical protein
MGLRPDLSHQKADFRQSPGFAVTQAKQETTLQDLLVMDDP